ncbi:gamma-glutamylcyclotransferase [Candidatus Poribacteria bacterium]|nr:MAG: gamma-glutamylcyclotransferase [Candidatus Poribacteria bacterium]
MQYFAYGSNMNVSQTQQRCPGITRIRKSELKGFRLVFNYHADIVPADEGIVHGGLWEITEDHEVALDTYEGYPDYYGKYYQDNVMFYRMKEASDNSEPPSRWYLKIIIQGYKDFGLTQTDFEESLGVQQLGLTQTDLEIILGLSMNELERLFSRVATSPVYQ